MSAQNEPPAVAVARAHVEAWGRHDFDTARSMLAPDVRVRVTTTAPYPPDTDLTGADKYMEGLHAYAEPIVPGSVNVLASTGELARVNIDDGDIFLGEFASGAICSVQSSFVTVGNYPGIEVRVYGSEGAAIARLIEEFGSCETLKVARPDDVEFREVQVPESYYPPGGSPRESWRTLYYANLTANFASEVLGEIAGNEGNFHDGLWVQEVVNAVEISHHERRWVGLPLQTERP